MSEPPKDKDQNKGDELLRRMLKTPPKKQQTKRDAQKAESSKPAAPSVTKKIVVKD